MLVDGRPDDRVSANDRGFLYGDGLFETLAVHEGRAVAFASHWQRLNAGCQRLGFDCPGAALLQDEILQVCTDWPRAVAKVVVTRGCGARGYTPGSETRSLRVVAAYPWPQGLAEKHAQGVAVKLLQHRLGSQRALAGLKHLSRLEQVYAARELTSSNCDEGLLCDSQGNLVEAIQSNVFAWQSGVLVTPSLERAGVAGIMRERVLASASSLGLPVRIATLPTTVLSRCEEMFLSNSVSGVVPINQINDRVLTIGSVSRRLQRALHEEWRN